MNRYLIIFLLFLFSCKNTVEHKTVYKKRTKGCTCHCKYHNNEIGYKEIELSYAGHGKRKRFVSVFAMANFLDGPYDNGDIKYTIRGHTIPAYVIDGKEYLCDGIISANETHTTFLSGSLEITTLSKNRVLISGKITQETRETLKELIKRHIEDIRQCPVHKNSNIVYNTKNGLIL